MKAVLFDCDGTLIDSLGLALESMNYALDQVGFPPRTPEEIKRFFGSAADRIFLGVLGGDKERALITDNMLPHSKPAPDGLLMACTRLGMEPKDCFYVGDSVMDLQAAHRAGAKAVAALWDVPVKPEAMAAENPAVMATTPMDVWMAFEAER